MMTFAVRLMGGAGLACLALTGVALADEAVSIKSPKPECAADVHYDQNAKGWPGYYADDADGRHCVPFTATPKLAPASYRGDFYVDAFTDAKVREAWADCVKQGPDCADPIRERLKTFIRKPFAATGTVNPWGKIEPDGDVNLADIRRPKFFGEAPYSEKIAEVDSRTWVVEVEVPSERYEHDALNVAPSKTWKVRGWYIEGKGVEDGQGKVVRPLVVMVGGRSIETTAIHALKDVKPWIYDAEKGAYVSAKYPESTEIWGMIQWREYLRKLNEAGFDVLTLDKRAHGISGGLDTSNTVEQARDIFRAVDAFETGKGLRIAGPDGTVLTGDTAAGKLLAGQKAREVPLLIGGASQGSMVAGHAMFLNFVCNRAFEEANEACGAPLGYNVKAGIAVAEFVHAVGYTPRVLIEGALRSEYHVPYVPSGEILGSIPKWPAVFLGRGLWDMAGGLEGALDVYNRATGLKEIAVVRGPHAEGASGPENVAHLQDRIVAFSKAVIHGDSEVPGAARFSNLKDLVLSAPPVWEESMQPAVK